MVEYAARLHTGYLRDKNEDNFFIDGVILTQEFRDRPFAINGFVDKPAVFAVCDGMGGEDNGEIASLLTVQQVKQLEGLVKSDKGYDLLEIVQLFVHKANVAVREHALETGKRMGATIAIVIVVENNVYCFNIGDSRIYALHKNRFQQITTDHTPDGKAGGKLTRCIGIGDDSSIDAYPPIHDSGRFLICSDGLTDMVSDAEIESVLRDSKHIIDAADSLLRKALDNGGKDNVTLIIVD